MSERGADVSLDIHEREREGIAILDCKGRLILGAETEAFRDRTQALLGNGKQNLILNMLQVEHIDSSGLGEMVNLASSIRDAQGQIKLVELNEKNMELLVITKISTLFETFNDEQDAVNSFFPDRQISTFDLLQFVQEIKEEKK